MLSQRFATELHVPLLPGVHYVEIASDLTDLREKVCYYVAHDAERNAIARAAGNTSTGISTPIISRPITWARSPS